MNEDKKSLAKFKYVYYKNYTFRKIVKKEGFECVRDFLESRTVVFRKNNYFYPVYTYNDIPVYWIIELLNKYKYSLIEELDTGNSYLIPLFLEYDIRIPELYMPNLTQYLYLDNIDTLYNIDKTLEPIIYSKLCEDRYPYDTDRELTEFITNTIIYNKF